MIPYLVEFLGSFLFFSVILATGEALPIAIALAASIFFGGKISGGHFNPAVSFMFFSKGQLSGVDLLGYVIVQILAAFLAVAFREMTKKNA